MKKLLSLQNATTKSDFAITLNIKPSSLTYKLYKSKPQYSEFTIDKASGGKRTIQAPDVHLKYIQKKLSTYLLDCIDEIDSQKSGGYAACFSHGFARRKSIITNAKKHTKKKLVLNLDLKDFFESFNFGRVRGFFIKNNNFLLDDHIATVIAQIACYKNSLPQGSPCSPVISNLITHSLDVKLVKLAKKNKCIYSRYADDITFSTRETTFPESIAELKNNNYTIGKKLRSEIKRSGFEINHKKTRVLFPFSRQDVTGLITNKKIGVKREYWRKVRAQCHSLFMTGEYSIIINEETTVGKQRALEGKLDFIDSIDRHNNFLPKPKNKKDLIYQKSNKTNYLDRLNVREKVFSKFLFYKYFYASPKPLILTEGKTDPIYLKSAMSSLFKDFPSLNNKQNKNKPDSLSIKLFKYNTRRKFLLNLDGGGNHLFEFARLYNEHFKRYKGPKPENPVIMVLDNDTGPNELIKYFENGKGSKSASIFPKSKAKIRNANFVHLSNNLYLVLTPLKRGNHSQNISNAYTEMENFFNQKVLNKKLNGKSFDLKGNKNVNTYFGKHIFSTRIILPNKDKISFAKFKPILKRIELAIKHYQINKNKLIK